MKFVMEIEPHTPKDKDRPCFECVLAHGPMCLDRSYCKFKETGKTWRKKLNEQTSQPEPAKEIDLWKKYSKKQLTEMRPYTPGEDLAGVSVNKEDTPEEGGMIARNSLNHNDQWYVAKKYFEDNYEKERSN